MSSSSQRTIQQENYYSCTDVQTIDMERRITQGELQVKSPGRVIISGATGCGKSYLAKYIIDHRDIIFDKKIHKVIILYGCWQPLYNTILIAHPDVIFIENYPEDFHKYLSPPECMDLVLVDDLLEIVLNSVRFCKEFLKFSHHLGFNLLLISQNMFYPAKYTRTINLQCSGMVLFKNPSDNLFLRYISQRIFPGKRNGVFLQEAFKTETGEGKHKYIYIDLDPGCRDDLRVRNKIYPDNDSPMIIYTEPTKPEKD